MTASKQSQDGTSSILTPDYGRRRCPKYVEFYKRIKLGLLVRLVGYLKRNSNVLSDLREHGTETVLFLAVS